MIGIGISGRFLSWFNRVRRELNSSTFFTPLKTSAILERGTGSPTFTRATTATVTDFEGLAKNCKSGESRFTGARRVENLFLASEDFTNTAWTIGGTASKVDASNANLPATNDYIRQYWSLPLGTNANRSYTVRTKISGSGTLNIILQDGSGIVISTSTVTLTSEPTEFTTTYVGGAANNSTSIGLIFMKAAGNTAMAITATKHQIEDTTGQANQNPSEYVSNGVLSTPYHGAGVDGVKYFPYENGNTVASNVITETQGAAIVDATLKGYLSESAATNLLIYSNDITNAAWAKTTLTTAKTSTGPDGLANSATRCTATGANSLALQTITAAASSRTSSFYVKRITGTGAFELTQDNISFTAKTTTAEWTRVDLNASILNAQVGFRIITSGDAFDIWCGQFEAGTFATSPIPTTTVAVTRNVDVLTYPTAGNINGTVGTVYAEVSLSSITTPGNAGILVSNVGYLMYTQVINNRLNAYDGSGVRTFSSGGSYLTGVRKIANSYSGTVSTLAKDGASSTVAFDGAYEINATLYVGNSAATEPLRGNIRNIRIWQTQLSDAILQAITS